MTDQVRLYSNSTLEPNTICFAMLPLVICADNLFTKQDKQTLLPFVIRVNGSRTDDKTEVMRRLALIVEFANKQADYAHRNRQCDADYAKRHAESAADYAAKYAKYARYSVWYDNIECAKSAVMDAMKSASNTGLYAANNAEWYAMTRDDLLTLFDQCFPKITEPQQAHIDRAKQLHELSSPEMAAPLRRAQESVKEEK